MTKELNIAKKNEEIAETENIATPPLENELNTDNSADIAFDHLDELLKEGKLPGTKVAKLKAKYNELNNILKEKHKTENKLLEDADNFPDNAESEVSKLRLELLRHHNDISEA